uniref:Uncharacterized protein n=1 Tax=Arundo donax TaxID=35708 RepID=A0A0A8XQG1_ARUDO
MSLSFIIFQMTRVISSPSISTMGFTTLMRCCSATAAAAA